MTKLTDQQIEAQIDAAIARQSEIDATEPRANKVVYSGGKDKSSSVIIYFNSHVLIETVCTSERAKISLNPTNN